MRGFLLAALLLCSAAHAQAQSFTVAQFRQLSSINRLLAITAFMEGWTLAINTTAPLDSLAYANRTKCFSERGQGERYFTIFEVWADAHPGAQTIQWSKALLFALYDDCGVNAPTEETRNAKAP